jgi:Tfp pilus assembly pilus retraction ATPase PilT
MGKENKEEELKNLIELKHRYKMQELDQELDNAIKMHQMDLETIRIKSAEVKRTINLKQDRNFAKSMAYKG